MNKMFSFANNILNPYKSFTEIGRDENSSKQDIDYHLKKAIKQYPVLRNFILIETRFYS